MEEEGAGASRKEKERASCFLSIVHHLNELFEWILFLHRVGSPSGSWLLVNEEVFTPLSKRAKWTLYHSLESKKRENQKNCLFLVNQPTIHSSARLGLARLHADGVKEATR